MKTLDLKWEQHQTTSGLTTHVGSESVTIGMCRAHICISDQPGNYLKPYKLYVNTRRMSKATEPDYTYHPTIEDAKRQATEELSIAIHNMCTELGYVLPQTPCTSNT